MKQIVQKDIKVFSNGQWITVPAIGSGSGLPDVAVSDNYKIPQVVNGEWVFTRSVNDKLNDLDLYLGSVDALTWQERIGYVRDGKGPKLFPVGTQFTTSHSVLGPLLWDVVAHDHFQNPADPGGHTITLLTHYSLHDGKKYMAKAFVVYYAENGLPAGDYCFTISGRSNFRSDNGKTVFFKLANNIPAGGQLRYYQDMQYNKSYDGGVLGVYSSPSATAYSELVTLSFTEISNATDLGTQGENGLNHGSFADSGIADYDLSDVRKWLNSDGAVGEWWEPSCGFDSVSYYHDYLETDANNLLGYETFPGFQFGMQSDFLSYVIPVDYPCVASSKYSITHDLAETFSVRDKFTLPAPMELGIHTTDAVSVGRVFPYFEDADDTSRIRNRSSSLAQARSYFCRQARTYSGGPGQGEAAMRAVSTKGQITDASSQNTQSLVVLCTLG